MHRRLQPPGSSGIEITDVEAPIQPAAEGFEFDASGLQRTFRELKARFQFANCDAATGGRGGESFTGNLPIDGNAAQERLLRKILIVHFSRERELSRRLVGWRHGGKVARVDADAVIG